MKKYFYFSMLFYISGCITSNEDLDIKEPLQKEKERPVELKIDKQVDAASVVKWQNHFQKDPSREEKKLLEQKLHKWEHSSSVIELVEKGKIEAQLGRIKSAEVSFREALRKDSDNIDILLELAILAFKQNQLEIAFEYLAKTRDEITTVEKPDLNIVFKYRYVLALSYIARGEVSDGRRILSEMINKDKTFVHAYIALAHSYIEENKLKAADFVVKRALEQGIKNIALYNLYGIIAEKNGNFEEAQIWYTKAIELQPSYASALVNRANLLIKQSLYEEAEDDVVRALIYDENHVEALIANGIIKKKLGKFDQAKVSFLKALDIKSDNPVARFNLAIMMLNVYDRPNEAIRLLQEVVISTKDGSELKTNALNYLHDIKEMRESF